MCKEHALGCDFVYWVYLIYFAELLVPVYLIFLLLYSFACPCPLDSSSLGLLIRTIYNKILVIGLVMISFVFASCIIFRAAELISSCWSYLGFRVFIHALPFLYILSIDFKGKTIYFEFQQTIFTVCMPVILMQCALSSLMFCLLHFNDSQVRDKL